MGWGGGPQTRHCRHTPAKVCRTSRSWFTPIDVGSELLVEAVLLRLVSLLESYFFVLPLSVRAIHSGMDCAKPIVNELGLLLHPENRVSI